MSNCVYMIHLHTFKRMQPRCEQWSARGRNGTMQPQLFRMQMRTSDEQQRVHGPSSRLSRGNALDIMSVTVFNDPVRTPRSWTSAHFFVDLQPSLDSQSVDNDHNWENCLIMVIVRYMVLSRKSHHRCQQCYWSSYGSRRL